MNQILEAMIHEVNPANDFNGWRDGSRTSRDFLTYVLSIQKHILRGANLGGIVGGTIGYFAGDTQKYWREGVMLGVIVDTSKIALGAFYYDCIARKRINPRQ